MKPVAVVQSDSKRSNLIVLMLAGAVPGLIVLLIAYWVRL